MEWKSREAFGDGLRRLAFREYACAALSTGNSVESAVSVGREMLAAEENLFGPLEDKAATAP